MQENLAYLPAVTSPGFSLIIPYYFVIGNTYTVVGIAKIQTITKRTVLFTIGVQ